MAVKHIKRGDKVTGRNEGATVPEANQPGPSHAEDMRRSSMAAEGMNEERGRHDYQGMAKVWKDGYMQGLNLCLQWQEDTERMIGDSVKKGLSESRQFLVWWKDWVDNQAQTQEEVQRQSNVANPMLGLTKQSTDAVLAAIEPILKQSETVAENSLGYYGRAVAAPSRTYVREINRQVLNVLIPS